MKNTMCIEHNLIQAKTSKQALQLMCEEASVLEAVSILAIALRPTRQNLNQMRATGEQGDDRRDRAVVLTGAKKPL